MLIRFAGDDRPQRLEMPVKWLVIGPYLVPRPQRVSIRQIQAKVCAYYRIPPLEMVSARRARCVARPRQIAMYLAKRLTKQSLPEIGRRFGNRDHTTVIHAVRTITRLRLEDPDFDRDVRIIGRAWG